MDGYRRGKYGIHFPVYDSMADDDGAMAFFRSTVVPEAWRSECERAGGIPIDEPTVTQSENLAYGSEIGTDDDGRPIIDRVKLYVRAWGPAWEPIP